MWQLSFTEKSNLFFIFKEQLVKKQNTGKLRIQKSQLQVGKYCKSWYATELRYEYSMYGGKVKRIRIKYDFWCL